MSETANMVVGVALSIISGCMTISQDQVSIKNPIKQEVNYNQAEDIGYRTAAEFFAKEDSLENTEAAREAYAVLEFVVTEDTAVSKDIENYLLELLKERVADEVYADSATLIRMSVRRLKFRTNWQKLTSRGRLMCLEAFANGVRKAILDFQT